uniref:Uncharacterized protein n=1 Tax=Arundo donax TaxID=35708 RepID=A0A0A9FX06_ARUDO
MTECATCLSILKMEVALSSRQGKRMWLLLLPSIISSS